MSEPPVFDFPFRDLEARPEGDLDATTGNVWLHLNAFQAEYLASGYVPRAVKTVLRELLDFRLEDERRAARPVLKAKRLPKPR